jgi:hypothetical protein
MQQMFICGDMLRLAPSDVPSVRLRTCEIIVGVVRCLLNPDSHIRLCESGIKKGQVFSYLISFSYLLLILPYNYNLILISSGSCVLLLNFFSSGDSRRKPEPNMRLENQLLLLIVVMPTGCEMRSFLNVRIIFRNVSLISLLV